ncbi:uncharacterized protein [Nicotiana sylvestris]|uniref:uncharacterized protein n=1 Tax=Nicotiana sylvestris TaxID=4096 RepID=UPI00388C814B
MSKIAIMLQLNGNWDNYCRFRDFEVDAIVVDENASYSILISTIAKQLSIDTSEKIVKIKYMVNDNCPPLKIRNDIGVRVYMETKKENKNLGSYPLCISVQDFNMELTITNDNTSAGSSGSLKLLDILSSYRGISNSELKDPVIEGMEIFVVKRSLKAVYWLVCVGENYKWHFKATSINDSAMFKIRSFNRQHTCSLMDETFIQRKRTAAVVGSMVIPKYCDPKTIYTLKDIQIDMLSEHGVNLSYMQAWRAKEKALQFLRGNPADSYSKLPKYFYILEETYPGSVVKLKKTADECFLYAFVVLCTSISGWQHCRPVVVVDGTFVKSAYRGIMLTASTMDATDRNESILKATSIVYTGMTHYSCMWYIWTNIRSKFKKGHLQLHELYFATARSYTLDEFNERMSKIEEVRASTDHIHTVLDGVKRYIVCLENKKCSCSQFQLEELPCAHALEALRHRNETYENYCSPYYTRESLLHMYEILVNPLPDERKWNVPQYILDEVVNPPTGDKRQSGRPQKERYKTYDEIKSKKYKVSCGNCRGEGHNKRSCKNAPKKK